MRKIYIYIYIYIYMVLGGSLLSAEFKGLFVSHVPLEMSVKNTIGVCASRTNAETVSLQSINTLRKKKGRKKEKFE